jgi:hypothetical protein
MQRARPATGRVKLTAMSPLLGGELVIAFLAARIAFWIWRSRANLGALLHGDGPPDPHGGRPLELSRPRLRLAPPPPPAAEPRSLPRAA